MTTKPRAREVMKLGSPLRASICPDGVGDSPPLAGDRFLGDWDGETVAAFFDDVRRRMPYDNPGKLTAQECADVVAYIFSVNKFPPGDRELAYDVTLLQQIRITKTP